jgi:hypothetical protein
VEGCKVVYNLAFALSLEFFGIQAEQSRKTLHPLFISTNHNTAFQPNQALPSPTMSTTYAAYYNIATSNNSSRKPSSTSTSSHKSTGSKIMNFLAPRIPVHEPLAPTSAAKKQQQPGMEREETEYQPARIYDSVLRRPLFQKAKKGNELTITERRISSSKPSVSSSADRAYDVHLSGTEYFGMDEKK